jgi:Sulfotransferase family
MTLPNFLIIGAIKSGTTSLYHYLRQHPDVFMSPVKETWYYWKEGEAEGRVRIRTRQEYERQFDGVASERAIGEASPQYLHSPTAPARIAADMPEVRLIASLRNPADRAYSSYLGRLRGGWERRSVEEAMRPGTYYVESSLYHAALSRYLGYFDRGHIKVILFDDLIADPHAVLRELYELLGIDDTFLADVAEQHNRGVVPRNVALNEVFWKSVARLRGLVPPSLRDTGLAGRAHRLLVKKPEPLPPAIRRELLAYFRDDIVKTEALIGRDLSRWLA